MTTAEPLVARQPVYDRSLRVVGYELIVQRPPEPSAIAQAGNAQATIEIGLNLVMGRLAYIPVSPAFLLEGYATALPADRVVLKISPTFELDEQTLAKLRELVSGGYSLMLDRFVFGGPTQPLLEIARVVGLEATAGGGLLRQAVAGVRPYGARLLAQDVEDHDELDICLAHGFDLLQGYFFCRPRVVSERAVEVGRVGSARLAATLHAPDVDFDVVQDVISRDVGLSYNLLRFINSAFFSLPRRVESIRDALSLLGLLNVRKWATLMALADVGDKPRELVVTGLVRARMCELLARAYAYDDPEGFFTTGLFSVVDALTDTSMVVLLASLPLSQEIISALLNYEGPRGRILRGVLAYERGNFAQLDGLTPPGRPLADLYAEAVEWATEAGGAIS